MGRFRAGLVLAVLLTLGWLGWEARASSPAMQTAGNESAINCTLHVSPDGSDAQPGSEQQPFRTIQYAADLVKGGDVICVHAGSYDERVQVKSSGTEGSKIVFWAEGAIDTRGFTILADYIRVEGFEVTNTPDHWRDGNGIYLQGRGVEIIGNAIHHTRIDGIACADREPFCSEAVIQGNTVSYADGSGINIFGSNNLVEGNDISHSVDALGGDADGIRFFGEGHIIRNNFIHDITNAEAPEAHTDCFQTFDNSKPPTSNVLIEGNICQNVDHQCMMASAETQRQSSKITFRDNICDNNGWQAVYILQIPYATIVNNTFTDQLRGSRAIVLGDGAHDAIVMNNIFFGSYSAYEVDDSSRVGFSADYNLKYPASGSQWNESHGLWGQDPQFVDPYNRDFHLQATSPAVDTGAVLPDVTTDLDGKPRPQGAGYDIGAYEYINHEILGDLNLDGIVDEADVRLCARVVLGLEEDAEVVRRADLNLDRKVDALDVQKMIHLIGGI